MALITTTDFTSGITRIARPNYDGSNLQDVIDLALEEILRDLMGDKLYNLYEADLNGSGNPQTQKYIDLVDGVTYEDCNGHETIYEGLKQMMKYFIFSRYKEEGIYQDVSTGQVRQASDVSEKSEWYNVSNEIKRFHDKGVLLYNQAIKYIYNHQNTYFDDVCDWTYKKKRMQSKLKTITT